MPRRLELDHVKTVRVKGREYHYFNTGRKTLSGKPIMLRLPPRDDPAFFPTYGSMVAGRNRRANVAKLETFASVADAYQKSAKFLNKAHNTRIAYGSYLKRILPLIGSAPVHDIARRDIMALLDRFDGLSARRTALVTTRQVFAFAKARELVASNPCDDIEADTDAVPHAPWDDAVIEDALQEPTIALAVALLYYTGQRIGDVCKLRWSNIENGVLSLVQEKTKSRVSMPVHSRLAAMLAQEDRGLTTILKTIHGKPITPAAIRHRIEKWASAKGLHLVPHGLRKNAVNALFECGCTVAEVSSITRQSLQLVEHYWKRWNASRLAVKAMKKWDA